LKSIVDDRESKVGVIRFDSFIDVPLQIKALQHLLIRGTTSKSVPLKSSGLKQKQRTTWCPSSNGSAFAALLQVRDELDESDNEVIALLCLLPKPIMVSK
jgi:hypothetical protein